MGMIIMYKVTQSLVNSNSVCFKGLKPSHLTEDAGVYVILIHTQSILNDNDDALDALNDYLSSIGYEIGANGDCLLYVGRTINKRVRLYQNHLQGTKATARLKIALVSNGIVATESDAKEFIKQYCSFKFLALPTQTVKEQYNFKLAEHQVKVDLEPVFID